MPRINEYKCNKCGECSKEQLRKIEESESQKAEEALAYNKSIEEARIRNEEELRIKEEKKRIEEDNWLELEKQIESQGEKLGGFIFVKNISGEPRQVSEDGIVYEFPYPAIEPTKVPVDLGKRLLATGQFEITTV